VLVTVDAGRTAASRAAAAASGYWGRAIGSWLGVPDSTVSLPHSLG